MGDGKNVVEERSEVRCHGVCRSDSKLAACLLAAIARLRYPFLVKSRMQ